MKFLVAIPVALLLLVGGWRVYIALHLQALIDAYGTPIDFATLTRSDKPNQYLVADAADVPGASRERAAVQIAVPPTRAVALFADAIEQGQGRILSRSADGLTLSVLQQTPIMAYPDFATLTVRPEAAGARVLIYSRSVYGHGDMGANRARVEGWIDRVTRASAP